MFTLTAVLSLAIGIGSTAVIFGVADAYLIPPLARHRRSRAARRDRARGHGGTGTLHRRRLHHLLVPNYRDYVQRQTGVSEALAAVRIGDAVGVGDGTNASRLSGAYVPTNYFSVLGTPMALGPRVCRRGHAADRAGDGGHHQPPSVALAVRR